MLDKPIPQAMATTRWEIIYQLGNSTKKGEAKHNKEIAENLPPNIDPKKALKEMDNMARVSGVLDKIHDTDTHGSRTINFKLTAFGWRLFGSIHDIEKRETKTIAKRGHNKNKVITIPKQESLFFKPSVGVDAVMSAVDELVKENASLRAGLISTMKIKLDSLNKLRELLGYGPLVESDKTEEETKK